MSQSRSDLSNIVCSHCGSTGVSQTDSLLCVSMSQWEKIKDADRGKTNRISTDFVTTFDNFVWWQINLCANCVDSAFKYYLESTKQKAIKSLIIKIAVLLFLGVFSIAAVSFFAFPSLWGDNAAQAISNRIKGIYMLPVIIGGLGIFIYFLRRFPKDVSDYKKESAELEQLRQSTATSGSIGEHVSKAFIGEAERIKETLARKKKNINFFGNYSLPKHRQKEELPSRLRESIAAEKSGLYAPKQSWEICKSLDQFQGMEIIAALSGRPCVVCWEEV